MTREQMITALEGMRATELFLGHYGHAETLDDVLAALRRDPAVLGAEAACDHEIVDGWCRKCRLSQIAVTGASCHHCNENAPGLPCWWCGRNSTNAALPASAPAVPDAEGKCPFQPGNCYWPSCGCRPPAAPPAVSAPPVTPEMPTVLIGDRVAYGEYPLTTVLGPLTAEAHNRHGWNVTAIERNGRVIWRKAEAP